jgi:hypothetical protein
MMSRLTNCETMSALLGERRVSKSRIEENGIHIFKLEIHVYRLKNSEHAILRI